ncbi:sensor histidine kinase [Amycolatopsis jiangsuensis]|uniref:histidine kinase n=1 Tax=Amycolatopsis jiangsuensis TaxID=1181879 RepID=A0A840IYT1_9PSEU|nr:nitrate- and nitrite sensing domain-containing protein [Amycolatopsis jiangsuensis]MBB4686853.1 signal transduction histidine kinase [Amycolatopsis jiangsuensis]
MQNKDEPGKAYDKSIRKRLTRTVLIPSITLLVLWTGLSAYFFINGLYVRLVAVSVRDVSIPALTALSSLQQERQDTLQYLDNTAAGPQQLQQQQRDTDGKLKGLQTAFDSAISSAPDEIATKITALRAQLDQLPVLRSQANFRSIDRAQVNSYYNGVLDSAATLFDTQARVVPDSQAVQGAISATTLFRASDLMSRETSLVSSALTSGSFSPEDFAAFTRLSGFYRTQLDQIAPFLEPAVQQHYRALVDSDAWQRLNAGETALIQHGPWTPADDDTVPVGAADWQALTTQVSDQLTQLTAEQADQVSAAAIDSGNSQLRNAIIGSVLVLLASLAAIIVAVRVSRSLVDRALMTRLARLRNDSLDLARNRLPGIVSRLRNGEPVDVTAELPKLDHGRDEIGQVAEAFNLAQTTAVTAAADEAKARSGVHNVFLGIAHRNQVLVHRQLQIIDEMESREENSTQLASLFQLDHLAARARRTTENLIILGGKQPGRRWRKPVTLMEILRAAVSETEQYSRVQVEQVPDVAIAGTAVADTIHLIAELVDNATSFSPPGSPVEVTSRVVARGVVVDVSDQGLGMKEGVRDWANAMMADAPEFDAMALRADSSLGLFVVARLASRLGITVTFDPSRYGGTRATVLVPSQHLAGEHPDGEHEDETPVLAPVGGPAEPEESPGSAAALPARVPARAAKPRPYPARPWPSPETAAAAPDSAAAPSRPAEPVARPPRHAEPAAGEEDLSRLQGDQRPRLPRRQPQQNLVAQLQDDPGAEAVDVEGTGETTARTLTAFHKGTRRARGGPNDR